MPKFQIIYREECERLETLQRAHHRSAQQTPLYNGCHIKYTYVYSLNRAPKHSDTYNTAKSADQGATPRRWEAPPCALRSHFRICHGFPLGTPRVHSHHVGLVCRALRTQYTPVHVWCMLFTVGPDRNQTLLAIRCTGWRPWSRQGINGMDGGGGGSVCVKGTPSCCLPPKRPQTQRRHPKRHQTQRRHPKKMMPSLTWMAK